MDFKQNQNKLHGKKIKENQKKRGQTNLLRYGCIDAVHIKKPYIYHLKESITRKNNARRQILKTL